MSNWKNVNNWVNKNCIQWARTYFQDELVGLKGEKDGHQVEITKMVECTGDVDLNQRKGKIITIYDVALKLDWKGLAADGTEATGTITIPEVAHDTEEDEYVFQISVNDDNNEKSVLKKPIKSSLVPLLQAKFSKFSQDLIEQHKSDVYIEASELGTAAPPRTA
ncbi:activator of Hsp90 ATPase [Radiomyces spectabilis]|uniref:activator of Hsp90 ATPase n=1 Tax=Radiomyces spectabilis TaxID=64574 RepID=UPI00221E8C04|nr:activator of Hsp90 ATPase [Radiomyces spectabilis]KAI8371532.1 activator of Hsp90 ATPase [Radiomyces spectabilis]